jgi:hypothetical protein
MTADHTPRADHDLSPTPTNWKKWRNNGGGPIWTAVLLSMNIHPTKQNIELLPTVDPVRNKEYRSRIDTVSHQYGVHPCLPLIQSAMRYGTRVIDRYVKFDEFLEFAKEMDWENLGEFEAGLYPNVVALSAQTSMVHSAGDLSKGDRYNMVRMGALLELLSKVVLEEIGAKSLVRNGDLNMSAVARQVKEIVLSFVKEGDKNSIYGFDEESNRKHFGKATKELKDIS